VTIENRFTKKRKDTPCELSTQFRKEMPPLTKLFQSEEINAFALVSNSAFIEKSFVTQFLCESPLNKFRPIIPLPFNSIVVQYLQLP
jgi:hypothetical protein